MSVLLFLFIMIGIPIILFFGSVTSVELGVGLFSGIVLFIVYFIVLVIIGVASAELVPGLVVGAVSSVVDKSEAPKQCATKKNKGKKILFNHEERFLRINNGLDSESWDKVAFDDIRAVYLIENGVLQKKCRMNRKQWFVYENYRFDSPEEDGNTFLGLCFLKNNYVDWHERCEFDSKQDLRFAYNRIEEIIVENKKKTREIL